MTAVGDLERVVDISVTSHVVMSPGEEEGTDALLIVTTNDSDGPLIFRCDRKILLALYADIEDLIEPVG